MAARRWKKLVVAIIGGVGLTAGVAMIFLPGPAIVVIPASLAILASEFEWAQKLLQRFREWVKMKAKKMGN
ncbi:PGPGW domain-containing protein [Geomesophilobacter sediminis]|uniref:PGPGW domain-containing protein n=1 Tax=Geomesophilobacter sediminis TaxID=2798584 RepID=A0A8J7JAA0_9BACT|nr:PGPGW domain-containing protein [Geomesophilobacter sediminis]MBJ6723771.1 PGPGW domain-containing protein [Geomesophilobacter sediminis]